MCHPPTACECRPIRPLEKTKREGPPQAACLPSRFRVRPSAGHSVFGASGAAGAASAGAAGAASAGAPELRQPEPVRPEPRQPEPRQPEPRQREPHQPEPRRSEPRPSEPCRPEPHQPEPRQPEPRRPAPARASWAAHSQPQRNQRPKPPATNSNPSSNHPFAKKTEVFVMRELRNHAIRISFHAIDPCSIGFIPDPFKKMLAAASP